MMTHAPPVIPPFRFTIVEDGILRSAYPTEENMRFLKRLKLSTILSLTPKPPRTELVDFCKEHGIDSVHYSCDKGKNSKVTLKPADVSAMLSILLNAEKHPILVHCLDGANITGILIMCLRRIQMWTPTAVFGEFSRFTKDRVIDTAESEFVNSFKQKVLLPDVLPSWLGEDDLINNPLLNPHDEDDTKTVTMFNRPHDEGNTQADAKSYSKKARGHGVDEISLAVRALALDGLSDYTPRR
eukprot:CFRG2723T1